MRPGGVLQDPVPQPAHQVRQAAAEAALPEDGVRLCDRAALLREAGGQDADRDPHPGHAAVRQHVPVAELGRGRARAPLRLLHVTQRSAAPGLRDVHLIFASLATSGASPRAQVRARLGTSSSSHSVAVVINLILSIINHDDGDICHETVMKRDITSRDTCQSGAQGRS